MATSEPLLPTPRASEFDGRGLAKRKPGTGGRILGETIRNARISSPVDSPANLFPPPDEDEVRKTIAISGRRCYESYENFIRSGSSVRMLAASLLGATVWYSNKCTLIWKVKVTKSKRLLFQLYPSTPRTEGIGSGLLQTPVADDSVNREKGKVNSRGEPKLSAQIVLLRTPQASDGEKGGPNQRDSGGAPQLAAQIAMLPTMRSSGRGGTEKGRDSVDSVIEMGATKGQIGQKTGLKLQPGFALWMMGYPTDWLDLADGEMPLSKAQEMRLCLKLLRKS
jgi:hypothetical protein